MVIHLRVSLFVMTFTHLPNLRAVQKIGSKESAIITINVSHPARALSVYVSYNTSGCNDDGLPMLSRGYHVNDPRRSEHKMELIKNMLLFPGSFTYAMYSEAHELIKGNGDAVSEFVGYMRDHYEESPHYAHRLSAMMSPFIGLVGQVNMLMNLGKLPVSPVLEEHYKNSVFSLYVKVANECVSDCV